jgi:hypothetical protein
MDNFLQSAVRRPLLAPQICHVDDRSWRAWKLSHYQSSLCYQLGLPRILVRRISESILNMSCMMGCMCYNKNFHDAVLKFYCMCFGTDHFVVAVRDESVSLFFTFMLPCFVRDLFLNNQPDALIIQMYSVMKLYVFRASSLRIITSCLPYIRHWQVSCKFLCLLPSRVLMELHPDSASKRSSKTWMKLTSAECTVENSWWWAEKMPETCRVL